MPLYKLTHFFFFFFPPVRENVLDASRLFRHASFCSVCCNTQVPEMNKNTTKVRQIIFMTFFAWPVLGTALLYIPTVRVCSNILPYTIVAIGLLKSELEGQVHLLRSCRRRRRCEPPRRCWSSVTLRSSIFTCIRSRTLSLGDWQQPNR